MITQPSSELSIPDAPERHQDVVALMASMPVIVSNDTPAAGVGPPSASRLLVLVPDLDVDEVALAQCVWSLAEPRSLAVLYLGISSDPFRESPVRRRLATLAAITRDNRIRVETRYLPAQNWPEAIQVTCRPGDLIVSPPERALSLQSNGYRSRRKALSAAVGVPVHVLPDPLFDTRPDRGRRLQRFLFWPVSLAILAGFFWLQVQIDQATSGSVQIILLSLSVFAEGGLLLLWHTLTSEEP
jgi:hypothetical protein